MAPSIEMGRKATGSLVLCSTSPICRQAKSGGKQASLPLDVLPLPPPLLVIFSPKFKNHLHSVALQRCWPPDKTFYPKVNASKTLSLS